MSIVWQTERDGTLYSLRSHGQSLRLYTNGVFHSQWNPTRPFAGGIWDCLSLPALYRPPDSVAKVLLLGVGGGAAIRQFAELTPTARVTGIELDPVHIEIAQQWFGVVNAELVCADAIEWVFGTDVRAPNTARYDIIVEDLFGHDHGEPMRAAPLEDDWVAALTALLNPAGLLIINTIDARELLRAVPVFKAAGYRYGRRWSLPAYDNAIGVFSREALHSRDWSRRLDALAVSTSVRRQARACRRQGLRGLDA